MAAMWRKTMLYLGLGPDEEYDDYDPGYDDPAAPGAGAPMASGLKKERGSFIGRTRPVT